MEIRRTTLTPDLFEPVAQDLQEREEISGPPISFWKDAWSRLKKNRGAVVGLGIIVVLILLAAIGLYLVPYSPYTQRLDVAFQGPSGEHWFGTDEFGRDLWARVWEGTRVSLYIAFLAAFLDLIMGVAYGAISAYSGGRVDSVMQRVLEILMGIPILISLILITLYFGAGVLSISIALAIVGWVPMALLVRGQVLKLKEQEFFLASRSLGAGGYRMLAKHLLPNVLGLVVVQLLFTIPNAIFFEAFLSFVGLGIQPPDASLGSLIDSGYQDMRYYPYLLWIPASILCLLMVGFNVFADGLRDALDPRMRV